MKKRAAATRGRMTTIELREFPPLSSSDHDQGPPIYRQSGSLRVSGGGVITRSASYKSVAQDETEGAAAASVIDSANCLRLTIQFVMANKLNFLLAMNMVVLLVGLSTLSILSALAHGRGFGAGGGGELPQIICGGGDADSNETSSCTITTNILPPSVQLDPDDLDAVALHELTRRDLFRIIKRAVRDTFLKPGNDTSILQLLTRDLTAHLESIQHPESGK